MLQLIEAALLTSVLFISDVVTKNKKNFFNYLAIFLIFAGIIFIFGTRLHANEFRFTDELDNDNNSFSSLQLECPSEYCFTTALTVIAANGLKSKLVAVTVQLLLQYGLDCIDEWDYIQNKLHWSEYHFEMMEFYQEVLKQG